MKKHEQGCWSGFVEGWVVGHVPAYAPEFDDPECLECKVIRGELIPDPNNSNLLIPATPIQRITRKPRAFIKKWWNLLWPCLLPLAAVAIAFFTPKL